MSFTVTTERILEPLGVLVLRDSRKDLLGKIKEESEIIPGKHGEILFGVKFGPKVLELHVSTEEFVGDREELKRNLAKHLNPLNGAKSLVFADDPDKVYMVKYAGRIPLTQHASWLDFTIPFKMSSPFIFSSEKQQTGSGALLNEGNVDAPLIIEADGSLSPPIEIVIGDTTLTYAGGIGEGETLTIDTETMEVELDGANALVNYSGGFPKLPPGETNVTASGQVKFIWRSRWA